MDIEVHSTSIFKYFQKRIKQTRSKNSSSNHYHKNLTNINDIPIFQRCNVAYCEIEFESENLKNFTNANVFVDDELTDFSQFGSKLEHFWRNNPEISNSISLVIEKQQVT